MDAFLLHVWTMCIVSLPTVVTYNLLFGKAKILHFGQIAFSLTGAYVFYVLLVQWNIPFVWSLFFGFLSIILLSSFFAWLSLRLEPDGLGVLSIAVHLMLLALVLNWQEVTRGALGISRIPRPPFATSPISFALFASACVLLWCVLIWWIDRGKIGRAAAALSEHGWYASSLGIHKPFLHWLLFVLAGVGALIVHLLFHSYVQLLNPIDFRFSAMIFFAMVVIAGGPGSFWGGIVSAVLLTFLREGLKFVPMAPSFKGPLQLILFGVILLLSVWWRRDTLFPQQRRV